MSSLEFYNLFSTVDLESLETKENDTVAKFTMRQKTERASCPQRSNNRNEQPTGTRRVQVSSEFKRADSRNAQRGGKQEHN